MHDLVGHLACAQKDSHVQELVQEVLEHILDCQLERLDLLAVFFVQLDGEGFVVDGVEADKGLVAHVGRVAGETLREDDEEVNQVAEVVFEELDVYLEGLRVEALVVVRQQELHRVEKDRHVLEALREEGDGLELLAEVGVGDFFLQAQRRLEDVEQRLLHRLDHALLAAVAPVLPQQLVDKLRGQFEAAAAVRLERFLGGRRGLGRVAKMRGQQLRVCLQLLRRKVFSEGGDLGQKLKEVFAKRDDFVAEFDLQ